ncbi:hypothetical protein GCK72_021288 [Caenorhabditis remanei]|uniref:DUF38 domain-containing protein n=1 Tax=Caenorhabditis remanei TaxID=31234 RepID=A0A6A5GIU7_CAERE|nr:hypothetical protein GCK72_021288 [Caenorhabditis remanei]KAF1754724.1 hypothetical protein GCK72_021288 [Caenorhabditis remanei]
MPFAYDQTNIHPIGLQFRFNDQVAEGVIEDWHFETKYHYKQVRGPAGVSSTAVTVHSSENIVDDYFISVVCEDVEAFVINQQERLSDFDLTSLFTYEDQKMLETNINRMCRCLENSLQSRTEKLKVEHITLSVLEINQVVSAVNLLDRDCLGIVTVHLPFEDQVFTADDFIPLIEGQRRQRLDLRIHLYEFSSQELEEVRKIFNCTSKQLYSICIKFKYMDEKCYELIEEATFCIVELYYMLSEISFTVKGAREEKEELIMKRYSELNQLDNKIPINIFEVTLIMKSIASHLGCPQIQSLRKVSRGIRQCVDDIKPDPHILSYYMGLRNFPHVAIDGMMDEGIAVSYKGSLEQDAVQVVNDFDLNTRHQKSCMDELYIEMYKEIWELLEENDWDRSIIFKLLRDVLISRASPLKARKLTFVFHWQCLMMEILPFFDAEFLNSIIIQRIQGIDKEYRIDLDEISKTEQWIKAKELCMKTLTVRTSIQDMNILNFETIDITMETMSLEDITYCRKNLTQPSVFIMFKIQIKNCSTADFLASLGEPYHVANNLKYIWFFRIENTLFYLHVVLQQIPQTTEGRLNLAKIHQGQTRFF